MPRCPNTGNTGAQGVRGLQGIQGGTGDKGATGNAGATDYCRYFGNVLLALMWARMAKISLEKQGEPFYDAKLASARFFFKRTR